MFLFPFNTFQRTCSNSISDISEHSGVRYPFVNGLRSLLCAFRNNHSDESDQTL